MHVLTALKVVKPQKAAFGTPEVGLPPFLDHFNSLALNHLFLVSEKKYKMPTFWFSPPFDKAVVILHSTMIHHVKERTTVSLVDFAQAPPSLTSLVKKQNHSPPGTGRGLSFSLCVATASIKAVHTHINGISVCLLYVLCTSLSVTPELAKWARQGSLCLVCGNVTPVMWFPLFWSNAFVHITVACSSLSHFSFFSFLNC